MKKFLATIMCILFTLIITIGPFLKLVAPAIYMGRAFDIFTGLSFFVLTVIVALSIERWINKVFEIND